MSSSIAFMPGTGKTGVQFPARVAGFDSPWSYHPPRWECLALIAKEGSDTSFFKSSFSHGFLYAMFPVAIFDIGLFARQLY